MFKVPGIMPDKTRPGVSSSMDGSLGMPLLLRFFLFQTMALNLFQLLDLSKAECFSTVSKIQTVRPSLTYLLLRATSTVTCKLKLLLKDQPLTHL